MRLKKWLFSKITISSFIILIILARIIYGYFSKTLDSYTNIIVKNYAEDIVIETINNSLLEGLDDDSFLIQKYDSNGTVAYAYLNSKKLNVVRYKVADNMNKIVDQINTHEDFQNIDIPLGYFLGAIFLNKSCSVPISIEVIGNENVDIKIETRTSGINTTILDIYLNITIEVVTFLPFKSTTITTCSKIPLAMEMVNSDVPLFLGDIVENK